MKNGLKIALLSILNLAVYAGVLFFLLSPHPGMPDEPFTEDYQKGDNFVGPRAGAHENDRDAVFDSMGVSPNDPDVVFVGTENNALFRSKDGGETWEWLRDDFYHDSRSYPEFYDITFDHTDPDNIYIATTGGPQPPSFNKAAGLYLTNDGGDTWERRISNLPNTSIDSILLTQDEEDTLYVGLNGSAPTHYALEGQDVRGGLFKSTDGGNTWTELISEEEYPDMRVQEIAAAGDLMYIKIINYANNKAGTEDWGVILRSQVRGDTWADITPTDFFPTHFDISADGKTIYVVDCSPGGQEVAKSTDTGETWQALQASACHNLAVSPLDSDFVMNIQTSRLYKSTDGLETQKEVYNSGEYAMEDIEYAPSNPNIIYVAGEGYRVYKSIDGGDSFTMVADLRAFVEERR